MYDILHRYTWQPTLLFLPECKKIMFYNKYLRKRLLFQILCHRFDLWKRTSSSKILYISELTIIDKQNRPRADLKITPGSRPVSGFESNP